MRVSNSFDPDIGRNYLQSLSADVTGRQRVKTLQILLSRILTSLAGKELTLSANHDCSRRQFCDIFLNFRKKRYDIS